MTISSRTPEGIPHRCPLCQQEVVIEPSPQTSDAPCPHCGCLLWFSQNDCDVGNSVSVPYRLQTDVSHSAIMPDDFEIPDFVADLVPASVARENIVVPLSEQRDRLVVASSDHLDLEKCDRLRFILNRRISFIYVSRTWIERKIEECYR